VGTHWEPVKNEKKNLTPPKNQTEKEIKARRLDKLGVLIY
jgi:hypothetical protein